MKKVFTVENSKVQIIPKGLVNISIPIKTQESSDQEHLSSLQKVKGLQKIRMVSSIDNRQPKP